MDYVGLLSAIPQESHALLRCLHGSQQFRHRSLNGKSMEISGQTCLLVTSGMGARRAGEAARKLVEIFAPRVLISFGIAGAVEGDLKIGDVVISQAVCRLDQGKPGPLLPLAVWSEAAQQAAAQALSTRGARLFTGIAMTTTGPQALEYKPGELPHPILEMETYGIAQVAAEAGIPLVSMRAISDGPGSPMPFDLGEMMDKDANLRLGRLLIAIARYPGIVSQLGGMARNTRIAADHAAAALLAAIGQTIF